MLGHHDSLGMRRFGESSSSSVLRAVHKQGAVVEDSKQDLSGFNKWVASSVNEDHSEAIRMLTREALTASQRCTLPPVEYMQVIGSHDVDHFVNVMQEYFVEIATSCLVSPSASVLDLGCGAGRLAIPFSQYLQTGGSYVGVDVWCEGIDWCRNNILPRDGVEFSFIHVPANDNYYFSPTLSGRRNDFSLSFIESGSIQLAFAVSTFTHLRREDALQYLCALRRILDPSGLVYMTAFVIDRYFHDEVGRTGRFADVCEEAPGQFYGYSGQDYFAGFGREVWAEMFEIAGLYPLVVETGSWVKKPGSRRYQDLFLLGCQ